MNIKSDRNSLILILTFIGVMIAIVALILDNKTESLGISIEKINYENFSQFTELDGLDASLVFENDSISTLYRQTYVLQNISSRSIIGQGEFSDLINEELFIDLPNNFRILRFHFDSEPDFILESLKQSNNSIKVKFLQWLENEKLSLSIFYTSKNDEVVNTDIQIKIDERQIVNGIVLHTSLLEEKDRKRAIDHFPSWLKNAITFISLTAYGVFLVFFAVSYILDIPALLNFEKWKKRKVYDQWIEFEEKLGKVQEKIVYRPEDLPEYLIKRYEDYTGEEYPEIPILNINPLISVIQFILILIIAAYPILIELEF